MYSTTAMLVYVDSPTVAVRSYLYMLFMTNMFYVVVYNFLSQEYMQMIPHNHISSVESQKGAINIQRCSVENQKGAIAV